MGGRVGITLSPMSGIFLYIHYSILLQERQSEAEIRTGFVVFVRTFFKGQQIICRDTFKTVGLVE
jgi:hypothetical protein